MRSQALVLTATVTASTFAFPAQHIEQAAKRDGILGDLLHASSDLVQGIAEEIDGVVSALDPFSSKDPVKVTGVHSFHPPAGEDQRGPCPGLNALANHGYINRNGVVSLTDAVKAIHQVYGMGVDLALILAIMGVVWTGDPITLDPSFSIGGNTTAVWNALDNVQGVLGTPQGIDYSHNFIEADASPTRNDLYMAGNAWTMNMTLFQELHDSVDCEETFTFEKMTSWAAKRWHDSCETNPNFYYGPFTGMIARNAGFMFIARMFPNYSNDSSKGELTHDTLKSFLAVYGEGDNMEYREGHEQIPIDWVHNQAEYGLVQLNLDIVSMILEYPELGSIGGNVGSVNSFAGVDLSDVLGGAGSAGQLLEGNNLLCFALEIVKMASPNYLSSLYATLAKPLELITDIISAPLLNLSCPAWDDMTMEGKPLWEALGDKFPGAGMDARAL